MLRLEWRWNAGIVQIFSESNANKKPAARLTVGGLWVFVFEDCQAILELMFFAVLVLLHFVAATVSTRSGHLLHHLVVQVLVNLFGCLI